MVEFKINNRAYREQLLVILASAGYAVKVREVCDDKNIGYYVQVLDICEAGAVVNTESNTTHRIGA